LPSVIDELEVELRKLGLDGKKIGVRMTGCPNGCVRPYQSDVGIVGRSGDKYTVYIGGNLVGSRLNYVLKDLVPLADIVKTLMPVLIDYKQNRQDKEAFGDYCYRLGADKARALLPM
jgi:sulfite reductase (ferredoxin)